MKKRWKLKTADSDDIIATVANTGAFSAFGVANGRTIPVVILESDKDNKIDLAINAHKGLPHGNCESQWGRTYDENSVFLRLQFIDPIAVKIIIPFDIVKNGATVDQIVHTQCLYLMTGEPGVKLSQNLHKEHILIEVPSRDFAAEWKKMFKKKYCNHIRKTHQIPRKAAEEVFEKMQDEFSCIRNLRMK